MTKENSSEVIMIVDRSGSMATCWNDTVGGINEFIKKNREVPGECKLSLAFFDTNYDMPFNGVDIQDSMFGSPMSFADYGPRGATALLDAIGKTINSVGARLASMSEADRPSKITMCIVTDGEENSSCEFSNEKIKEMIQHQTDKYQWDFVYLGANQDAFSVGGALGIKGVNCANYAGQHTGHAFAGASMRCCVSRSGGTVDSMASYYSSSLADAGIQDDLNPPSVSISSDDNQ